MNRRTIARKLRNGFGRIIADDRALRRARRTYKTTQRRAKKLGKQNSRLRQSVNQLCDDRLPRVAGQNEVLDRELVSLGREFHCAVPESTRGSAEYSSVLQRLRRGRATGLDQEEGLDEPIFLFNSKLASLQFAQAHGAQIPCQFGPWPTPEEIPLDEFGDRFVVKSTHGYGARGVYPLLRVDDEYLDLVGKKRITTNQLFAALRTQYRPDAVYYVEEFIGHRRDCFRQADDVTVYCSYGQITHLEIWRDKWTRYEGGKHARMRSFRPDGTPMRRPRPFMNDRSELEPPDDLATLIDICCRMSRAIRRPLVRFDFFEADRGWIFSELAKNPSVTPVFFASCNNEFGTILEDGFARLFTDLVAECSMGVRWGSGS